MDINDTYFTLTAVSVSLEMKPQLKDVVMKLTSESAFVRIFPFPVDNLERDVLIRRARVKSQNSKVLIIGTRCQKVFRRSIFINKIWIEDVELIALHNLGRRIVHVVVCLIVLVPLEASVHAIEVTRLTWSILVGPEIDLRLQRRLDAKLRLVRAHALACLPVHRLLLAR